MTREELDNLFRIKNENGEMLFVMQADGYLWGMDCSKNLMTEDNLVDWAKEELTGVLSDYVLDGYDFAYDWLSKNISNVYYS